MNVYARITEKNWPFFGRAHLNIKNKLLGHRALCNKLINILQNLNCENMPVAFDFGQHLRYTYWSWWLIYYLFVLSLYNLDGHSQMDCMPTVYGDNIFLWLPILNVKLNHRAANCCCWRREFPCSNRNITFCHQTRVENYAWTMVFTKMAEGNHTLTNAMINLHDYNLNNVTE